MDSDSVPASVSTDEIYERYLKKAISEINELGDELARAVTSFACRSSGPAIRSRTSGCLKFSPKPARSKRCRVLRALGTAVLKSLQRLHVDPLAVYGTNCLKFGTEDPADARDWLTRELYIVQPKLIVVMGERSSAFVDELEFPLSDGLRADTLGEIQRFTPTVDALVTPDIETRRRGPREDTPSGTRSRRSAPVGGATSY